MPRIPLLSGTRAVVVDAPADAVVLRPPAPGPGIGDVAAGVRDALRFPLAGEPLEALLAPGARVTLVVEPPALPIPGSARDPRADALAATIEELVRLGVPTEAQAILVAGGLARRAGRHELESLLAPDAARRYHGRVAVHDAEDRALVHLGDAGGVPLRVHPLLVDTDLVVAVTAAETVLHGGPAALLAATGREAVRAAAADSLLEATGSAGWRLGVELESRLAERAPVFGVSLVLNHPRLGGALHGYPYEPDALEAVARSPLRRGFGLLPGPVRARLLHAIGSEISVAAVFGGPPSVAQAEALLRGVEARAASLDRPLDAMCIGIPRATPYLPRERPNPLLAALLGLGLALRLWRDAFPIVEGGTAILLHRFHRAFAHPTQQPYRAFFGAAPIARDPVELARAEHAAVADTRAIDAYRHGRACHPLLPFADWAACGPALARLGTVLVAGCRDAVAARQLGFVPVHGINAALSMAHARAAGGARIGYLLSPPYFPLRVGGG